MIRARLRAAVLSLALAATVGAVQAGALSGRYCDRATALDAAQQDRLLRFAAEVKRELEASGDTVALVARSGLNLSRVGLRYSHAGVVLRDRVDAGAAWSVRQLYYACDEGVPRLYDQGLAGFVGGTDDPALGYVSIVLLPRDAAAALDAAARDKPRALRLLAATYSANAYAFGLRYQNCNQWVMELLATAWGNLADGANLRERAQGWLRTHGYAPRPVEVNSHLLMLAATFVPWLHRDDHPDEDLAALRFRTSVPASIEAFVRERVSDARRIELCHNGVRVVVRRGWEPIAGGCEAAAGDLVVALD